MLRAWLMVMPHCKHVAGSLDEPCRWNAGKDGREEEICERDRVTLGEKTGVGRVDRGSEGTCISGHSSPDKPCLFLDLSAVRGKPSTGVPTLRRCGIKRTQRTLCLTKCTVVQDHKMQPCREGANTPRSPPQDIPRVGITQATHPAQG